MSVQKHSSLLSQNENQLIFSLIGPRCQTLCTAVVQLYATSAPNHNQWTFKDVGVLCFVKDNNQKNFFFRLYCLYKNCLLWEHPLYINIEYNVSTTFFHIFEGENCVIAFNFADPTEAGEFKQIVQQKIIQRNKREERKRVREYGSSHQQLQHQPLENTRTFSASVTTLPKNKKKPKKEKKNKNKAEKKKILKADIGDPLDFKHVGHVGFDINKGFELNLQDESLKELFKKAGVSESDLSDARTQSFIANFIEENGGINAVRDYNKSAANVIRGWPQLPPRLEVSPPPVATRTGSLGQRQPPSPTEIEYYEIVEPSPPRVPQRNTTRAAPSASTYEPSQRFHPPTVPSALKYESSQRYPPPPPTATPPPLPPPMLQRSPSIPKRPAPPNNGALFDSIRQGTSLKHVAAPETGPVSPVQDSRGQLLDQIRQGRALKPVNMREVAEEAKPVRDNGNDLASALARALQARSKAFQKNESDESDTSSEDDDEWE